MKRSENAALRLGAPRDTCKQCNAGFVCEELPLDPLDWGVFADPQKRARRKLENGDPVRFVVREAPRVTNEDLKFPVQFHGPFCSEDCALSWAEPRKNATRHHRPTEWDVYVAQWGGPTAGHSEVDGQIQPQKLKAGQVWLPIGKI